MLRLDERKIRKTLHGPKNDGRKIIYLPPFNLKASKSSKVLPISLLKTVTLKNCKNRHNTSRPSIFRLKTQLQNSKVPNMVEIKVSHLKLNPGRTRNNRPNIFGVLVSRTPSSQKCNIYEIKLSF